MSTMGELRLILLVAGAILIAGIWWWNRRNAPDDAAPGPKPHAPRAEPHLEVPHSASHRGIGLPVAGGPSTQPDTRRDDAPDEDADPPTVRAQSSFDPDNNMLLSLLVLPEHGERFLGNDVLAVLEDSGLRYGDLRIFHRHDPAGVKLWSMANMLEPGYLEPDALQTDYVHGLVLFAVLPARLQGSEVFADMLATARRIAARLHGELADADRGSLTPQTIQHLREKVIEFERRRSGAGT